MKHNFVHKVEVSVTYCIIIFDFRIHKNKKVAFGFFFFQEVRKFFYRKIKCAIISS